MTDAQIREAILLRLYDDPILEGKRITAIQYDVESEQITLSLENEDEDPWAGVQIHDGE